MSFKRNFSYFLDLTKASMADLAQALDYDRSYISKWYNGKSLPSPGKWDEIRPNMASFFASRMDEEARDIFTSSPLFIMDEKDEACLKEVIDSFLDDGYMAALRDREIEQCQEEAPTTQVIQSPEAIAKEVYRLIKRLSSKGLITYCIYYNDDIVKPVNEEIITYLRSPYTAEEYYFFRFMVETKDKDPASPESLKDLHHFFRLQAAVPFVDFQVYLRPPLNQVSHNLGISPCPTEDGGAKFAIGHHAGGYSTRASRDPKMLAFFLYDEDLVKDIYLDLQAQFDKAERVFFPEKDHMEAIKILDTPFSSPGRAHFSSLPIYLAPPRPGQVPGPGPLPKRKRDLALGPRALLLHPGKPGPLDSDPGSHRQGPKRRKSHPLRRGSPPQGPSPG